MPKVATFSPLQKRFIEEYPLDLNATQAAIRAGYSAKTAGAAGGRLLHNVKIQQALIVIQQEIGKRNAVTQDWIIQHLRENVERAMQIRPVYDKKGDPTGEYTYEGNVANRALELLGKHLGMFQDALVTINQDNRQVTFVVKYEDRGDYGQNRAKSLEQGDGRMPPGS